VEIPKKDGKMRKLGIPTVRDRIAQYYFARYNARVNPQNEILISAGSKILIYMCMQIILNPGDEVLIHEPAWLSYQEQARLCGAEVKFIPYFSIKNWNKLWKP
jgi:aspartate aminotransferase/aminotransferase